MISQILNRRFVLEQLEEVKIHLEALTQEGKERRQAEKLTEGAEDLSMDDYKTTLDLVSESIEKEEKKLTKLIDSSSVQEEKISKILKTISTLENTKKYFSKKM